VALAIILAGYHWRIARVTAIALSLSAWLTIAQSSRRSRSCSSTSA
jgi:hypothetical protein